MQVHGRVVQVPGRALLGVVELLKDGIPADAYQLLKDYHGLVVDSLKAQPGAEQRPDQSDAGQAARQKLPGLKAAAGVADAAAAAEEEGRPDAPAAQEQLESVT